MKRLLLMSSCIVIIASPANAAKWLNLGVGSSGAKMQIDLDSIKADGDYATAWVKNIYPAPKSPAKTIKDRTRSTMEIWKFDCKNQKAAVTYYVGYDARGSSIYTDKSGQIYPSFEPVIPDSMGEAAMNFICKYAANGNT